MNDISIKNKDFLTSLMSGAGAAIVTGVFGYFISSRFGFTDDLKSIIVGICVLLGSLATIYLRQGVGRVSDELGEKFMNERTGILKTFPNLETCAKEMQGDFEKSKNIRLLLQIGRREFGNQEPSLFWVLSKEKIGADSQIRVLKASPQSPFLSEIRAQKRSSSKFEQWQSDLRRLNESLDLLKNVYHSRVEIREHSEPFLWRIFLFDEVAYVSAYLYGSNNDRQAVVYKLLKNQKSLFTVFDKYFEYLWLKYDPEGIDPNSEVCRLDMTQVNYKTEALFYNLEEALKDYVSGDGLHLIKTYFKDVRSFVGSKTGFNETFLQIGLLAALDIAKLRLPPEFVASALLYFPFSSGDLSVEWIEQIDKSVALTITRLVTAGKPFDQFLPWDKSAYYSNLENKPDSQNKDGWKKIEEQDDKKVKFLLSNLPEISIVNVIVRLHVVRLIGQIAKGIEVQKAIATETLTIHASVAEILGVWDVKWRVDDAAFKILNPKFYKEIVTDLNEHRREREQVLNQAIEILQNKLNSNGLPATVTGRAKHIYGLYLKTLQTDLSVHEVNDNLGLRVIVEDEIDCYLALDILFETWEPVEGIYGDELYRDWIKSPKSNGYQSIHTTVYYREANYRLLEVQIRTREMHQVAEYGVAAHWLYKKIGNSPKEQTRYQQDIEQATTLRKSFEKRQLERSISEKVFANDLRSLRAALEQLQIPSENIVEIETILSQSNEVDKLSKQIYDWITKMTIKATADIGGADTTTNSIALIDAIENYLK